MRPHVGLLALALCIALAGCSTHRKSLESNAPPQGAPTQGAGGVGAIVFSLLDRQSNRLDLLSSEALAPLTEAAAITFIRTGSSHAFALTQHFASGLLAARVTRAGVSGFFGSGRPSVPQAGLTAISGLALTEAYAATGNPTYKAAALGAAIGVASPALGWVSSARGTGVRQGPGLAPNISMTANAALLFKRAGAHTNPALLLKSRAAFLTIYSSQAAVGSWYANVGGHVAMNLAEWGTTLFDLSADGSKASLGILGGGMPHLYANAFDTGGQLLNNAQTSAGPDGVALALRALASWEDTGRAEKAFAQMLKLGRRDGTISLAPPDDTVGQAYFALAFAQRLAGPAHGE
jgi:hypothetical protein